jgi:hypothetical protein
MHELVSTHNEVRIMDPLSPAIPARRSIPVFAVLLVAVLMTLGIVFA